MFGFSRWPVRKKVREKRNRDFLARLKLIDESRAAGVGAGPGEWSVGRGQVEFLALATAGAYPQQWIVIDVNGSPMQDPGREENDAWMRASPEEVLAHVTGYWLCVLRTSEAQPWVSTTEFSFASLRDLERFLVPLRPEWKGAVQSHTMLLSDDLSPDWMP